MKKQFFFPENHFFQVYEPTGPARTGKNEIKKNRKFSSRRMAGPAGPDRHRPGPAFKGPIKQVPSLWSLIPGSHSIDLIADPQVVSIDPTNPGRRGSQVA